MATSTTTDLESDRITLRHVEWDTYRKLRDEPAHQGLGMDYFDGELTITLARISDGVLILSRVNWSTYEKLRDDEANHHLRMDYLDGDLKIMSPQIRHDLDSCRLLYVITAVVRAWRIRFLAVGTTTLRLKGRLDLEGAAKEPDEGFYLGDDAARVRDLATLDLAIHPPPSLAIEVDHLADSEESLATYARIRVPEVWRYKTRERTLWFGRLVGTGYESIDRSLGLPRLTPTLVLEALAAARAEDRDELDWLDWLDGWARALPESPEDLR